MSASNPNPVAAARLRRPPAEGSAWLKSVPVDGKDLTAHRDGYCAQTLAPAYFGHHTATLPQNEHWQKAHHTTAGQYAHTIAALAAPGAAVWIHDYPLQLVPGLLRRLRPDLRIGFSLHSPFPPAQTLQAIAERDQITSSLLAADLATFADARSAANFTACAGGDTVAPAVMPMPADAHAIAHAAATATARTAAGRIRARLHPATTVFLSTGGTDSGDGTIARLNAFARLLADGALREGTAVLIHLAPKQERRTGENAALRHDIERLTAQINGKHGTVGYMPVHYQRQDLTEAAAAITATAIALATHTMPSKTFTTERFLATTASQAHHPDFTHHLSITRTLVRHRAGPAETIATLDTTSSALRTVPAALTAYLRHPTDPAAAIRYALSLGGHTHATATITAALAGARNPGYTPPAAWRTNIDSLNIHTIAAAMAGLKNPHPQPWRQP